MSAPVDAARAERLATLLLRVRDGAPLLDPPPADLAPPDLASAYAAAHRIVATLEPTLGPVRGYKVGATSSGGQKMLGLDEPFYGCDPARTLLGDGATWHSRRSVYTVEAEVGFVVGRDLPPRDAPYEFSEVRDALARAVPLLEINRPAYARPFEVGGLWLVADNGVTQGLVTGGPGVAVAAAGGSLALETVRTTRNGATCAEGAASVVLGDPLRAVHWLATALNRHGRGLRAGDVVASGAMTPPVAMMPGDRFVATYATLGEVRLSVA
jgi:2-keto-4-pentenoate hydratase